MLEKNSNMVDKLESHNSLRIKKFIDCSISNLVPDVICVDDFILDRWYGFENWMHFIHI